MLDPFVTMPASSRQALRADYRAYLDERDGSLDVERRQLSRREARMDALLSVGASRSLDRALFDAQYADYDRRRTTPVEMQILLAMVKVNGAEAYGVDTTFETIFGRVASGEDDDTELRLLVEESYHTRILLSATRIFGFDVDRPYAPPLSLRTMIAAIGHSPKALARPLVLASEVLGTIVFANLFLRIDRLLAHDPELRDAIAERLVDVLVDELGHVTFNRMMLGSGGVAIARRLLPIAARGTYRVVPEFEALGLPLSTDVSVLDRLPESIRRQAFVA